VHRPTTPNDESCEEQDHQAKVQGGVGTKMEQREGSTTTQANQQTERSEERSEAIPEYLKTGSRVNCTTTDNALQIEQISAPVRAYRNSNMRMRRQRRDSHTLPAVVYTVRKREGEVKEGGWDWWHEGGDAAWISKINQTNTGIHQGDEKIHILIRQTSIQ